MTSKIQEKILWWGVPIDGHTLALSTGTSSLRLHFLSWYTLKKHKHQRQMVASQDRFISFQQVCGSVYYCMYCFKMYKSLHIFCLLYFKCSLLTLFYITIVANCKQLAEQVSCYSVCCHLFPYYTLLISVLYLFILLNLV